MIHGENTKGTFKEISNFILCMATQTTRQFGQANTNVCASQSSL